MTDIEDIWREQADLLRVRQREQAERRADRANKIADVAARIFVLGMLIGLYILFFTRIGK